MSHSYTFFLELVSFLIVVPAIGFVVMKAIDIIQKLLATKKRRDRWLAMCIIVTGYLVAKGGIIGL